MVLFRRAEELSLAHAQIEGCAEGNAGLLLIEAAVGCGKSEFLETVAGHARSRGCVVLRGMGTAAEKGDPLGVLRQLTADAPAGALAHPPQAPEAGRVEAMQAFALSVRELSAAAPVVICVDDLHHADELSTRHLLHLARGSRQARILLVFTESLHERGADPLLRTELLRLPHFLRLRLERLRPEAVRAMLPDRAETETDRLYQASGGNPLLLRALLQDPSARPGDAYTQAVLTCLHRCGAVTPELAEAIAALGALASPAHIARLSGTTETAAARAAAALDAAGLLDGPGLRHPAARAAVLDRMDPAARSELHRRCALLARACGAPDTEVARQLLAARHTAEDWALPVLRSAADQYLADGAPDRAAALLRLAHEACPDDARRADIGIRLAAVAARTDPAAAERHLLEPLAALAEGRLEPRAFGPLARVLAAQGRIDESAAVLERMAGPDGRRPAAPLRPGEVPGDDPLDGLSAFPQWAAPDRTALPGRGAPSRAVPPGPSPTRRPCGRCPRSRRRPRPPTPPNCSCAAPPSPKAPSNPWYRPCAPSSTCTERPARCPGARGSSGRPASAAPPAGRPSSPGCSPRRGCAWATSPAPRKPPKERCARSPSAVAAPCSAASPAPWCGRTRPWAAPRRPRPCSAGPSPTGRAAASTA
ncbi:AAA family ATPase [Streptomyces cirratus]|uniref:AAA family ATPase n=1 Tax=Streptomyces cirratus TaxID=68187 RepID=UPI00361C4126